MGELQQSTITIESITEKNGRHTVKSTSGGTYSFFEKKKDGNNTVAYQQFLDMNLKEGLTVDISYDTTQGTYEGKTVNYKNIKSFREASVQKGEVPQTVPQKAIQEKPDWDAISRGKVRHGVVCAMIEAKWSEEDIRSKLSLYVDLIMNDDKPKEEVAIDVEDIGF